MQKNAQMPSKYIKRRVSTFKKKLQITVNINQNTYSMSSFFFSLKLYQLGNLSTLMLEKVFSFGYLFIFLQTYLFIFRVPEFVSPPKHLGEPATFVPSTFACLSCFCLLSCYCNTACNVFMWKVLCYFFELHFSRTKNGNFLLFYWLMT